MKHFQFILLLAGSFFLPTITSAGDKIESPKNPNVWPQWRGPSRDGKWTGPAWPERLSEDSLKLLWRIPLGPSYSGPIVSEDLVFTTETTNKESEVVIALDRKTGKERWRAEWKGALYAGGASVTKLDKKTGWSSWKKTTEAR